jgi:hypothetical protein
MRRQLQDLHTLIVRLIRLVSDHPQMDRNLFSQALSVSQRIFATAHDVNLEKYLPEKRRASAKAEFEGPMFMPVIIDGPTYTIDDDDGRWRRSVAVLRMAVEPLLASATIAAISGKRKPGRPKKGQPKGNPKVLAALTAHHARRDAPIGVRDLADKAGVEPSTVSKFFKAKFPSGHRGYETACEKKAIAGLLRKWQGETVSRHATLRDDAD